MQKKQNNTWEIARFWHIGQRGSNQDSILVRQMKKGKRICTLLVVCDGIGGLQEGEKASGHIVYQLSSWFVQKGCKSKSLQQGKRQMKRLLYQIHRQLQNYGRIQNIQMGSTICFVFMIGRRYFWGQVGDSRLYRIQKKKCKCLSHDQIHANGALLYAIGVGDWKIPKCKYGKLHKNEALLLCTDGFYRGLSEEQILQYLNPANSEAPLQRRLDQLGQKKLSMGEQDNLSALLVALH